MNYCILNDANEIENIIVCEDDETAAQFGAVPAYDGARIGDVYAPPPPPPSLDDRVGALEAETAAISAAIERGLSL